MKSESGTTEILCTDCYNKTIAELTDAELPSHIPKTIYFEDCAREAHMFHIEFMLFPHCKTLKAYENYNDGYVCEVYGGLDDSFSVMWEKLIGKLSKMLSVKYIDGNSWTNDKVAGYVNYDCETESHYVVIDGNRYEWSELGKQLGTYEGFQIKIEFADLGDDLL